MQVLPAQKGDQCLSWSEKCWHLRQGTSRGGADIKEIVKRIDMWAIDMVFVVGGNGGNAGAQV